MNVRRDYDTAHASGGISWVEGWQRRPAYAHDHVTAIDDGGQVTREPAAPYTWTTDYRGVTAAATDLLTAAGFDAEGNDPHAPTDVDSDGYATTLDYTAGHASGLTTDEIDAAHRQRGESCGSITVIPGDPLKDRHSRAWEQRGTADARRRPRDGDVTVIHPDGTTRTVPAKLHDAKGRQGNRQYDSPAEATAARAARYPKFRCADCRRSVRARDERITEKVCRGCGEARLATPTVIHDLTNV